MSAAPTDDDSSELTSTRPYLIRALHEWCTDNGLTPYIAVLADDAVQVPREYVQNGEIVLNISVDATSALKLDNDYIEFKARFGGVAREIIVPVDHVMAIYARENGQGMAFAVPVQGAPGAVGAATMPGVGGEAGNADTAAMGQAPTVQDAPGARSPIQLVSTAAPSDDEPPEPPPPRPRPALKRIK